MSGASDDTLDLLQRWHAGDRDGIVELVRRDAGWIEAQIRQRRGDAVRQMFETQDQFQELMLEVLAFTPRFLVADRGQFRGLLARMIENDMVDAGRRAKRRQAFARHDFSEGQVSLNPAVTLPTSPSEAAAEREELGWLRLGIEFIGAEDRDLIERHMFAGEQFTELAEELGVGAGTLRMRYSRALVRLAGVVQRLQHGELDTLLMTSE